MATTGMKYKLPFWASHGSSYAPQGALAGGKAQNGDILYVGRALGAQENYIPGEINVRGEVCYISNNHKEYKCTDFQYLIVPEGLETEWVNDSHGNIPTGAIQGGFSETNEPLYIGRAEHKDTLSIGKVHPSHKVLYIPHTGKEHKISDYQVLCLKTIHV